MSYQSKPLKKSFNGKEVVPLSVAKEILEIRGQIESGHQHAGPQLELVYQAYSEVQLAHGHQPIKLDPSCSGCTVNMNTLLKNWFKLYDKGSVVQKAYTGALKSKPLVPVKDKKIAKTVKIAKDLSNQGKAPTKEASTSKYDSMIYNELLKEFKAIASEEDRDSINNGNSPKKPQLLKYLNGK